MKSTRILSDLAVELATPPFPKTLPDKDTAELSELAAAR